LRRLELNFRRRRQRLRQRPIMQRGSRQDEQIKQLIVELRDFG
jgi:predicted alpha/beta-hydrolase family hydrolase